MTAPGNTSKPASQMNASWVCVPSIARSSAMFVCRRARRHRAQSGLWLEVRGPRYLRAWASSCRCGCWPRSLLAKPLAPNFRETRGANDAPALSLFRAAVGDVFALAGSPQLDRDGAVLSDGDVGLGVGLHDAELYQRGRFSRAVPLLGRACGGLRGRCLTESGGCLGKSRRSTGASARRPASARNC